VEVGEGEGEEEGIVCVVVGAVVGAVGVIVDVVGVGVNVVVDDGFKKPTDGLTVVVVGFVGVEVAEGVVEVEEFEDN